MTLIFLNSTLHFGINAVKAILKLASQLDFKQHQCRGDYNKYLRDVRAEANALKLKNELGIYVKDWFSVDGNSARTFFRNAERVAELLEVPLFLIKDIGTMWTTICSGFAIDVDKFARFCDNFVSKFRNDNSINFYQFSPTLHKILCHTKGNSISETKEIFK